MKEILIGITAIGIVAALITIVQKNCTKSRSKLDLSDSQEETIDGELHFKDVIDFFKTKQLDKGTHIPFVGFNPEKLFGMNLTPIDKFKKEGYITVFLGVYNEVEERIEHSFIIHCLSIDQETQEISDKAHEGVVVLQ